MPKLVRLYIKHTIIGFALSGAFVTMLLWSNVANLWHLISSSPTGYLAGFLLFMFNGIVFSGVQFGIAIMRMAENDDHDDKGKRQREPVLSEAFVPVPVHDDRRMPRRG